MSHKKLRPFIVKVSVLGYFPLNDDQILSMMQSHSMLPKVSARHQKLMVMVITK